MSKKKPIKFQDKKTLNKHINKHLQDKVTEIRQQAIQDTLTSLECMLIMILHDDFKFSIADLEKFLKIYDTQFDCLVQGYVALDDFKAWCIDKDIQIKIN